IRKAGSRRYAETGGTAATRLRYSTAGLVPKRPTSEKRLDATVRLEIDTQYGLIAVVDEPTYTFTSRDNVRSYPCELRLSNDSLTSTRGLELAGRRVLDDGATGGRLAIHAQSAVAIDDKLYLAVGKRVAGFVIAPP